MIWCVDRGVRNISVTRLRQFDDVRRDGRRGGHQTIGLDHTGATPYRFPTTWRFVNRIAGHAKQPAKEVEECAQAPAPGHDIMGHGASPEPGPHWPRLGKEDWA
jgi:hypothetical protein